MFHGNVGWLSTHYISHKTELFITTSVRTSYPISCLVHTGLLFDSVDGSSFFYTSVNIYRTAGCHSQRSENFKSNKICFCFGFHFNSSWWTTLHWTVPQLRLNFFLLSIPTWQRGNILQTYFLFNTSANNFQLRWFDVHDYDVLSICTLLITIILYINLLRSAIKMVFAAHISTVYCETGVQNHSWGKEKTTGVLFAT
jgi:hypothetical protein